MKAPLIKFGVALSALSLTLVPFIALRANAGTSPKPKAKLAANSAVEKSTPGTARNSKEVVHLLNRISFGPAPGDVERVKAMGVDAYIEQQLHPQSIQLPERIQQVSKATALTETPARLFLSYGRPALKTIATKANSDKPEDKKELQKMLRDTYHKLFDETATARIERAAESPAQLQEVMTDFWYNHFNISIEKNLDHLWVGSFEETAIRPYALGKFRDLLGATAHHAAMLFYLDNWQNTSPNSELAQVANRNKKSANRFKGINENYARELMELHTLGVDGGYTQKDVQELARVLTGLGLPPGAGGGFGLRNKGQRLLMARGGAGGFRGNAGPNGPGGPGGAGGSNGSGGSNGFGGPGVRQFPTGSTGGSPAPMMQEQGSAMFEQGIQDNVPNEILNNKYGCYFDARRHDFGEKVVVGHHIAGTGEAEIEQVLDILSKHPSTAHHISYQLAQYFVSDTPPASLVDKMAAKFTQTDGDIASVLNTLFHSTEFWDTKAVNAKFKSPYRYLISTLRATNAQIENVQPSTGMLTQLGMPLYKCLTPDGYKNTKEAWLNPDNLINRLNFAAAYGVGRFPGIRPTVQDPTKLADCIGPSLSDKTIEAVMNSPNNMQISLLLGSPEFMKY